MGANKLSHSHTTYFKPLRGFLVTKINPDDPNEDRMSFKFSTGSYEYAVFSSLDGYITSMEVKDIDYGKMLNIYLSDGPDNFCLSMKYDSDEAIDFYNRMKKVDFRKDVQFVHWKPKDKAYYRLLVMQQGDEGKWQSVGYSFEKDEVPAWREVEMNGEKKWDRGPALKFYAQHLKEVIEQVALYGNTAKRPEPVELDIPNGDNDLPF